MVCFIKVIFQIILLFQGDEKVIDLFSDLSDGKILHKLLESLSGKKVGKINPARIKLQKIENVEKCLKFMSDQGLHLENIGALDIVEGKQNLILGLLWSIIQHYEMSNSFNRVRRIVFCLFIV